MDFENKEFGHEAMIKGWCPGALSPMVSGDGLVVRIRPRYAQLTQSQIVGLCDAAESFGSGVIDLTNRANLQLRGVTQHSFPLLIKSLSDLDLVDACPNIEAKRNLLVAFDWLEGDETHEITSLLLSRLSELPDLPSKIGFAIDAGDAPILTNDSADFRIERDDCGRLMFRAEGHASGTPLKSAEDAVSMLINITYWFMETGGELSGRMSRHRVQLPEWAQAVTSPAQSRSFETLGKHSLGAVYGLPFGQIHAVDLKNAVEQSGALNIRLTPWRRIVLENASVLHYKGLLSEDNYAELFANACSGAPYCSQATVETRKLAKKLSGAMSGHVHVSGCAKGCAYPHKAKVCLTGRNGLYDVAFSARAGETPQLINLTEYQVISYFGVN